jgi:heavy metal efflux system protein
MSLGALDFGLIVDGAVIIVEATMHQLSQNKSYQNVVRLKQGEMDGIVKESAGKMMNSAVFGQVVILIVYLPIFTLQGIEGKMFTPMAQTVAFALVGAFILSLTYVPMMSTILLSKNISHKLTWSDKVIGRLERVYQYYLSKALRIPKLILFSVMGLFVASVLVLFSLGGEFIPALEEGDFAVETRVLTGSNLNVSVDVCLKAERILLEKFPEVKMVVGKTGSSEIPTDPMPIEASDLMIILKDKSEWTSATTFDELAVKMKAELEAIPGVSFGFQYPVQMRFNELMTGARQDVVCKIFGENLDTLSDRAHKLGKLVSGIDGTADLYIEAVTGMPEIVIDYNRSAIAQYGLSINDVNNVVRAAFSGQASGMVYEGERKFNLIVRMDKSKRADLRDVQNLLIPTPQYKQIPLHALASIKIVNGPNQIQREDTKRRIVVGFNVRGRDVQSIVQELQKSIDANIELPTGYTITYGGAFKNLEEAKTRLGIAVPVALLLIFVLLYFAFHSVKQGLLIYTAIPLSAIGGILALALRGMPFSISAGVGFIALFGVAVLNGIVLIAEFNQLKEKGYVNFKKIVLVGTKVRMRPVLMTAFVASLGFLPMAISNGSGAEVQRPLATVVIGGLLLATFLTLFLLPILYVIFNNGYKLKNKVLPLLFIGLLLVTGVTNANAQIPIELQAALDTAVVNNLVLKNESLKAEYQQKLIKTSAAIPQATIQAQYGQFNSEYSDNSIGISQAFEFPTVYSNRKRAMKDEWNRSVFSVELKEAELKKQVTQIFNTYLYLSQKKSLLVAVDSIYNTFLTQANLRLKLGEINVIEKASIENQRHQIANQLSQVVADIEIVALQFQLVLNSTQNFIPKGSAFKMKYDGIVDASQVNQHPLLKVLQAENKVARSNVRLAKSKFLPNLTVGYNSATIYGTGNDGVFYNYNKRFQTLQAGIGIPIFLGSYRGGLQTAKINSKITENSLAYEMKNLENQYAVALRQHQLQQKIIEEQEVIVIPNSKIIAEAANKQFRNGEINYLEWGMLVNQSIAVKNNYLDAVFKYNENIIQLMYLSNQ